MSSFSLYRELYILSHCNVYSYSSSGLKETFVAVAIPSTSLVIIVFTIPAERLLGLKANLIKMLTC